ncbi:MAG: hypothetical protein MUE96_04515 [Bacteroidia bacterium]|jgi:signal transduction histidine kinase|nr:hypothetical protein [Bacteroidia bacterium]
MLYKLNIVLLLVWICSEPVQAGERFQLIDLNNSNELTERYMRDIAQDNVGFVWLISNSSVFRFDGKRYEKFALPTNLRPLHFFKSMTTDSIYLIATNNRTFTIHNGRLHECVWISLYKNIVFGNGNMACELNPKLLKGINECIEKGLITLPTPSMVNYNLILLNTSEFYLISKESIYYFNGRAVSFYCKKRFVGLPGLLQSDGQLYIIDRTTGEGVSLSQLPVSNIVVNFQRIGSFEDAAVPYHVINKYVAIGNNVYTIERDHHAFRLHYYFSHPDVKTIHNIRYVDQLKGFYMATSNGFYLAVKEQFNHITDHHAKNITKAIIKLGDSILIAPKNFIKAKHRLDIDIDTMEDRMLFKKATTLYFGKYFQLWKYDLRTAKSQFIHQLRTEATCMVQVDDKIAWVTDYSTIYKLVNDKVEKQYMIKHKYAYIYQFLTLNTTEFLLATSEGLIWTDLKTEKVLIPGIEARVLTKDQEHVLVGTYGQGVFIYNTKTGDIRSIKTLTPDALDHSHSFTLDSNNHYWISTNNGIARVKREELLGAANQQLPIKNCVIYGLQDGLQNIEMNGGASPCALFEGSQIYYSSMLGVVTFNPYTVNLPYEKPYVGIDKIDVNGIPWKGDLQNLILPNTTKNITIAIGSPSVVTYKNTIIEYRIPELDTNWQILNPDRSINLLGLPTGKFNLELRKSIPFTATPAVSYVLQFQIQPFFYQTWWFKLLVVICIVVVGYGIIMARTFLLKRQNKLLQFEVNTQTKSLMQSNRNNELLMNILMHDIRSPIKSMEFITIHLLKQLPEAGLKQIGSKLLKSIQSIYDFTSNYLVWYHITKDNLVIEKQEVNLSKTVDGILKLYEESIAINGNQTQVYIDTNTQIKTDEEGFKTIIRNLIDNANKHSKASVIRVISAQQGSFTQLQITNTLGSYNNWEEIHQRVSEAMNIEKNAIEVNPKKSLGLYIVSYLCYKLKINIRYSINQTENSITFILDFE